MAERRPLVDRVLARLGLSRASARPRGIRIFQGAKEGRITMDWFTGRTSADQEIRQDLLRLRNRSRTIVRDTPIGRRYVDLFAENVAGEHGLRFRPRCLLPNGERDTVLNEKLADAWAEWSLPECCTLDGLLDWAGLHQTVRRLEPMDGEVLLRHIRGAPNKFGYAVQLLDPDQLADELNANPAGAGAPYVRQGVEKDQYGRPVRYHIWDGHPSDSRAAGRPRPIPAADILHQFRPFRPGASRGLPWLHAALESVHVMGGYIESTLVASRMAANQNTFYKPGDKADDQDEDETHPLPQDTAPGEGYELPPGYDVVFNDPKQPHSEFGPFVKAMLRLVAAAGGVSYTSLSGDLESVNYSSIRAGLLAERDLYKQLQRRDAVQFARPIYLAWLEMAQLSGALRLTMDEYRRARTQFDFVARGFPWVDPKNDLDTLDGEIKLGINSRTNAAQERGRDYERTLAELDAEQALAVEYGVDVSGAKGPGLTITAPAKPDPDEKDSSMVDAAANPDSNVQATALNGAQVTALLEVIQAVAGAQLPKETAKQVIAAAFPLIDESVIDAMLDGLDGFEPAAPSDTPKPSTTDGQP